MTTSRTTTSRWRTSIVISAIVVAGLVAAALALFTGSYAAAPDDVLRALGGTGDERTRVIVADLRLPRIVAALLVGAALALAGAIFQTVSRNPLGSPDIVGFSAGSATGALVCLVLVTPALDPAIGAWAGGIGALLVVLLLTGGAALGSDRTILAGIGLAALLAAVNDFLLTRAPTETARVATTWLFGSLNATGWPETRTGLVAASIAVAVFVLLRRALRMSELGDDTAAALGVRVRPQRLLLLLLAAFLTGTATAVAGPIGFVALAAPQIAKRALGAGRIPPWSSMLLGAVLLLVADLAAQRVLAPLQLPVGLVTGMLGGAYLFWLVARRRG